MIRRTLAAAFLNGVANDPDVRPRLGGEGPIELGAVIGDPANIALETAHGGWVLVRHEPGTYELHTLFRPEGRGRGYFAAAGQALDFVFAASDAREIVTRVPACNPAAAFAAARCGFVERFARRRAWRGEDGRLEPVSYQALDIDGWARRSAAALEAGRRFHDELEAAKADAGCARPAHEPDEAHDRAAGATALMAIAGQARKAVWFYNRWARLAGYETIALLAEAPAVFDVGDAIVQARGDGRMEVLKCR